MDWNVNVVWFRAARILLGLLLWISAFSCIVNLIADIEQSPLSWRLQEYPSQLELDMENAFRFYLNGLYWAIVTFTTVCYGDFHANTAGERAWLFFYVFCNIIFFAYITGSVVSWLQAAERDRVAVVERVVMVKQWALFRGLPPDLTHEVMRVVRFMSLVKTSHVEDSEFLLEMHPQLRTEAAEHIRETVLHNWRFAGLIDLPFLTAMVVHFHQRAFHQGEDIIVEGTTGSKMCILVSGTVAVMKEQRVIATYSSPGLVLGERALFQEGLVRPYTVVAVKYCQCLVLKREEFMRIAQRFAGSIGNLVSEYANTLDVFDICQQRGGLSGNIDQDFSATRYEIEKKA